MFWQYNSLTLIWCVCVALLILVPGNQVADTEEILLFDKAAHFGVFTVMTFLMIVSFVKQSKYVRLRREPIKFSLVIAGTYGLVLELLQIIIPGRSSNHIDLIFNYSGILFGYLLFLLIYKFSLD